MIPRDPEWWRGCSPTRLELDTPGLGGPVDLVEAAAKALRAHDQVPHGTYSFTWGHPSLADEVRSLN